MKIITASELFSLPKNELSALFGRVSSKLVATEANSVERAAALASLENIERAMCRTLCA